MAKFIADVVTDLAAAKVATCTRVSITVGQPANFAGIAAISQGSYVLTAGSGNGDWLIADGDVSGRKVTLLSQAGNNATGTGNTDHLAFDDGVTLLAVNTTVVEAVVIGEPFNIAALRVAEWRDPV